MAMPNVLVVAEIQGGALKKATLTALTFARDAAQRLGGAVHVVALGKGIAKAAAELAAYAPVVHAADHAALENPVAETYAQAIAQAANAAGAELIAMAAT